MKVKQLLSQNRRDFQAIYECEHCGQTIERHGYDDTYFHRNVIPQMKCTGCGKTSGEGYVPLKPRYDDSTVV